jgi:hypothetical protein
MHWLGEGHGDVQGRRGQMILMQQIMHQQAKKTKAYAKDACTQG